MNPNSYEAKARKAEKAERQDRYQKAVAGLLRKGALLAYFTAAAGASILLASLVWGLPMSFLIKGGGAAFTLALTGAGILLARYLKYKAEFVAEDDSDD